MAIMLLYLHDMCTHVPTFPAQYALPDDPIKATLPMPVLYTN